MSGPGVNAGAFVLREFDDRGVNVSVYFFLKKLTVTLTFHSLGLTL